MGMDEETGRKPPGFVRDVGNMKLPVLVGGVVVVIVAAIVIALSTVTGPGLPGEAEETDRGHRPRDETSRGHVSEPVEPEPDPDGEPPADPTEPSDPSARSEIPRDRITGIILDDQDRPLAGARVFLGFQTSLSSGPPLVGILDGPVISDAAGKFAGHGVRLAGAELLVRLDGYALIGPRLSVTLDGKPMTIRMRRLLRILGNVVDDSTGETIGKATLLLRRAKATGEVDESVAALGYEPKGGEFTIPDLAPGLYLLSASVPGYDGWMSDLITLSREHPDERLEIRVSRTGPWGALRIVVQGPDGTAVPRVNRVYLYNPNTGFLAMTELGVPTPLRLEAPVGRQDLHVFADGFQRYRRIVEVPDGGETEIAVTLREAGHVRIRVSDGDGNPVAGYRLAVFAPDGDELEYDLRIVDHDEDWPAPGGRMDDVPVPEEEDPPTEGTIGRNQVIPGGDVTLKNLPPGLYRIKASKDGVNPVEQTVEVKASGTTRVELTLR